MTLRSKLAIPMIIGVMDHIQISAPAAAEYVEKVKRPVRSK